MLSSNFGTEGLYQRAGHIQDRSDFLELQKILHNIQSLFVERFDKLEKRFEQMDERLSQERDRPSNLEESVRRALDDVMPKVEELLARHQSPQEAPQEAPPHASAEDSLPRENPQQSLHAVGGGNLLSANASASDKPLECAAVTDAEGRATDSSDQPRPPTGASLASRGSEISGATSDPPASLQEAAERGDAAAVQRCLADGSPVDARDKRGNTALHSAASNGHDKVVDILIANGSAVNRCGHRARSPLHCAAVAGHEAIVALLVAAGANVNLPDADGATAAALAALQGHVDVVLRLLAKRKFLEEGTTLPMKTDNIESPLLLCSKKGYDDAVRRCLRVAESADVVWSFVDAARDLVLGPAGEEALVEAAADGRLEAMEALLRVGVGAKSSREQALRAAAEKGRRGCIAALLDEGVDVNARDNKTEHTALYLAAINGHAECVEELLQRGAKMEEVGEMLVNVARGGHLDVVKVLLRVGVGAKCFREQALRAAAQKGHRGCIAALVDDGVDVNAQNINTKRTAPYLAAINGHAECVEELLQRGANMGQVGEMLVDATSGGHLDVVKVLLRVGVGAKCFREKALRAAAEKGHRGCIAALVDDGVDVNAQDINTKRTAPYLAAINGHAECVEELLKRGAKMEEVGEMLVDAALHGFLDVVKVLLRVRVNTHASREKALWAAAEKGHRGCIAALLDEGLYVSARDNRTAPTALYLAAINGHAECVEELLQRGAKTNQVDAQLVQAARGGQLDMVEVLLRVGVGAMLSREEALLAAAARGHRGCIAALLDDGVDVNARDERQWTALHWSAWQGKPECMNELLQRGANKELKTSGEETALYLADVKRYRECTDILKKY